MRSVCMLLAAVLLSGCTSIVARKPTVSFEKEPFVQAFFAYDRVWTQMMALSQFTCTQTKIRQAMVRPPSGLLATSGPVPGEALCQKIGEINEQWQQHSMTVLARIAVADSGQVLSADSLSTLVGFIEVASKILITLAPILLL